MFVTMKMTHKVTRGDVNSADQAAVDCRKLLLFLLSLKKASDSLCWRW